MNRQSEDRARSSPVPLRRLLDAAADDLRQPPPPALRARVLAAARAAMLAPGAPVEPAPAAAAALGAVPTGAEDSAAGPQPWWRSGRPWAWSGLAVCVLLLAGSAWLMLTGGPQGLPAGALMAADTRPWRETGFLPLVPPERWPAGSEAEAAWLVRTELAAERLAALGLPFDPARAALRVPAELLLHPSGEVLAVRLLH